MNDFEQKDKKLPGKNETLPKFPMRVDKYYYFGEGEYYCYDCFTSSKLKSKLVPDPTYEWRCPVCFPETEPVIVPAER